MKNQRMARQPSQRRDSTTEENLSRFEEMKLGTPEGLRWCLRAKIRYDDLNGTLRDPVIYRCNVLPHHRTGFVYLFNSERPSFVSVPLLRFEESHVISYSGTSKARNGRSTQPMILLAPLSIQSKVSLMPWELMNIVTEIHNIGGCKKP